VGVLTEAAQPVRVVEVPAGPGVLDTLLPAVEAALGGGPAVLPVPEGSGARTARLLAALRPDDPVDTGTALVVPTSGSTGEPKGVLLGADAVTTAAGASHERLGGPGHWLLALPATHVGGLQVLVRSLVAGTTPVVLDLTDGFDADEFAAATVRLFARTTGRRYTALVPTQLRRILDADKAVQDAARAYHAILLGGAAAPEPLLERAALAEVRVVTTYGMTETSGGCTYDGRPLPGVELAVDGEGRIVVSGAQVASGHRTPGGDEPILDRTFRTSDLGRLDDGLLTVLGRVDDVVVTGGVNVPLPAVEAVVEVHPDVESAACTSVEDPEWGQRVVAVLVPADRGSPPSLQQVRDFVAERAPGPYAPRQVVVVDALPLLPNGKVDRLALADLARQGNALRVGLAVAARTST
jgi:o-succinylbenzoate---CoA ligase